MRTKEQDQNGLGGSLGTSCRKWLSVILMAFPIIPVSPARAATGPDAAEICNRVAAEAARATGVPLEVLRAISLAETGRRAQGAFRPWPWTVNMEGEGKWFPTLDEALSYVRTEYSRGARSFDLGCFQVNYKWHGENFASVDHMFDPQANALYAAELLRSLFAETGSWPAAAGAYHSRTPEFADRYRKRFERILADVGGGAAFASVVDPGGQVAARHGVPAEAVPTIPDIVARAGSTSLAAAEVARVNLYPLLQGGAAGALGSLMPVADGSGAPMIAISGAVP